MNEEKKLSIRERDAHVPPSYQVWLDEVEPIKDDPLSFESLINIIAFAYKFRYATLKNAPAPIVIDDKVIYCQTIIDAFTKKGAYADFSDTQILRLIEEADKLPCAPVQLGETTSSFKAFVDALKNPAQRAAEFHIDADNPAQLYAAKMLLETVFTVRLGVRRDDSRSEDQTTDPYMPSIWAYNRALCDDNSNDTNYRRIISPKNSLLMQGDPIQKIASYAGRTSLDVLLANTHFSTGEFLMCLEDEAGQSDGFKVIIQEREEYRRLIKKELTRLYADVKTKHVLAALGEIMRAQECHLMFTKFPTTMEDFGVISTDGVSTQGFYDNNNTVVCASFIWPYYNAIIPNQLGFVIHEALHLIFDKLIKNASSPVLTYEDIEEFDRLIVADQVHRHTLFPNADARRSFTTEEQDLWDGVVSVLEEHSFYFENLSAEGEKQVMRKEIIVRPMQYLTAGCSEQAIQKMMPNIWGFYQRRCQPMIEAYVSRQQELSMDQSVARLALLSGGLESEAAIALQPYPSLSEPLTTLNLAVSIPLPSTFVEPVSDKSQDCKPCYP